MGWAWSGRRTKAGDETCYGWMPFWQAIGQFLAPTAGSELTASDRG
jgi:hypothetical protein